MNQAAATGVSLHPSEREKNMTVEAASGASASGIDVPTP